MGKSCHWRIVREIFIMVFSMLLFCPAGQVLSDSLKVVKQEEHMMVFPGKEWDRRKPGDFGIPQDVIDEIGEKMKLARSNGVLVKNGYLVAEWNCAGAPETRFNAKSITKSILGMLFCLALDDGLVPGPHARVRELWPDFDAGPYTKDITFDNLMTATSGVKTIAPYWQHYTRNLSRGRDFRPPGMPGEYYNDHSMYLAGALTYLFEKDLLEVLRERILVKIGAEADWMTNGEGAPDGLGDHGKYRSFESDRPVMPPGYVNLRNGKKARWVTGFSRSCWSARDLARVGWLILNEGKWKGEKVMPGLPVVKYKSVIPETPYMSWKIDENGSWFMTGSGGQFCMIMPKEKIVLAKVNEWRNAENTGNKTMVEVNRLHLAPILVKLMGKEDKKPD